METVAPLQDSVRQYIFRISVLGMSWTSWGYKISGR